MLRGHCNGNGNLRGSGCNAAVVWAEYWVFVLQEVEVGKAEVGASILALCVRRGNQWKGSDHAGSRAPASRQQMRSEGAYERLWKDSVARIRARQFWKSQR